MSDRTPSLAEIVKEYVAAQLAEMHACMPAIVESFDSDAQTVDVQPSIKRRLKHEDGTVSFERLPKIQKVPILYPRGGGFFSYMPLAKGDRVLLHFTDYSLDQWYDNGRETEPSFAHSHDLTDCFAVPAAYPKPENLSGLGTSDAVLGKGSDVHLVLKSNGEVHAGQDNPSEYVALAEKTKTEIQKVLTALQGATYILATGPGVTGGTTTPLVVVSPTLNAPASTKLKAAG